MDKISAGMSHDKLQTTALKLYTEIHTQSHTTVNNSSFQYCTRNYGKPKNVTDCYCSCYYCY